jgi:hypothetical protein
VTNALARPHARRCAPTANAHVHEVIRGRTSITGRILGRTRSAANATAAAVLRRCGSTSTRWAGSRVAARIARSCSSPHTTHTRSLVATRRARATVASSSVCLPSTRRNGFGTADREAGQKRSPAPPARITAWMRGRAEVTSSASDADVLEAGRAHRRRVVDVAEIDHRPREQRLDALGSTSGTGSREITSTSAPRFA